MFRLKALIYSLIISFVIILTRLFYLQVSNNDKFSTLGEKNFLRIETIYPPRGNLYDCNNTLLASNRPVFNAFWHGQGDARLSSHKKEVLLKLEQLLDTDLTSDEQLQKFSLAERYSRRAQIKHDISFAQLCKISEQLCDCPWLVISHCFERVYPHGSLASHILGYLSRVEKIGRSGVERVFQKSLQGETGYSLNVINSTGKKLSQKEFCDAKPGSDVFLTLDFEMQKIAESLFDKDQTGAFVLMDAHTGAVRVLVSTPSFDPNAFLQPISEKEWQEKMIPNNPLMNRVTNALYPPASTFKLVTVAAALEEGIIDAQSEYFCKGYVKFGGRRYACMKHSGHGNILPHYALVKSCNAYLYEISKRISVDKLAMYANWFGLGKKTDFLLPEQAGIVPTMEWKIATKGEKIWKGEVLSIGIGQGFLLVTPLQIARMVASICSGYLVKPRILETETCEKTPLPFTQSTLNFLKDAMKDTVNSGTGRLLSRIENVDVYVKTGTAQTCALGKTIVSKKQLEHAWITGFFADKNGGPWYSFAILVENVGSSKPALQIAYNFIRAYSDRLKKLK